MPRGGFGGGYRGGYRGGFGGRRGGYPLMMGGGMGMGGLGGGSPLLTSLLAGGVGYAIGGSTAQNAQAQGAPQYVVAPPYYPAPPAAPVYYPAPPAAPQGAGAGTDSGSLAQLKLLGDLHDRGVLTDNEFAAEKKNIIYGA